MILFCLPCACVFVLSEPMDFVLVCLCSMCSRVNTMRECGLRWRRVWQPCHELRENLFSYVFFFYMLDVVSIIVYDRHT